ncbi:arylsulfatase [Singulisphaera sp. PoT]|uniref:arylsulfatase n=1 Tax=Singulisphaera sp. PoT TaxID=3411797 RepID=UPI003BF45EC0
MKPSYERWAVRGLVLLAMIWTTPRGIGAEAKRPNVVFILADDLGFSDLGCYGGEIETPNVDRLAKQGLRFTQCYNTARCWPSRAAFLTGYYPQQVNRDPAAIRPKWAALLPQLLKPAGYRSYHSGKWHVDGPVLAGGFERSYHLEDPDRFFTPRVHNLDDASLPQPKPDDGYYSTRNIAEHALTWLSEHESKHRDDPFFLYVAFTSPHFPIQALPEDIAKYRGRYKDGWDRIRRARWEKQKALGIVSGALSDRDPKTIPEWNVPEADLKSKISPGEAAYAVAWDDLSDEQKAFQASKMEVHAAMVDRIDREVGRIVAKLEASHQLENTIILVASDNGASAEQLIRGDGHDPAASPGSAKSFLCLGPGWSTAANTPFRLHKSWVHEGGISTPLIVHWPAGIEAKGELRHTPAHLVDFMPTFLELAGASAPTTWDGEARSPLSGRSLVPAFAKDVNVDREFLYFKHVGNRGLRVGDWKIVALKDSPWELYNLADDRVESKNLAASHPDKVKELAEIWTKHDAEYQKQGATGKPLPKGAARKGARKAAGQS